MRWRILTDIPKLKSPVSAWKLPPGLPKKKNVFEFALPFAKVPHFSPEIIETAGCMLHTCTLVCFCEIMQSQTCVLRAPRAPLFIGYSGHKSEKRSPSYPYLLCHLLRRVSERGVLERCYNVIWGPGFTSRHVFEKGADRDPSSEDFFSTVFLRVCRQVNKRLNTTTRALSEKRA